MTALELLPGPATVAPLVNIDYAAVTAAYWPQRHYWRERAIDLIPNVVHARRELVIAARSFAALWAIDDQLFRQTGHGLSDPTATMEELAAVRRCRNPLDVAARCAVAVMTNVAAKATWQAPAAPDAFEGVRHATVSKRSNSGRTNTTVVRAGVAVVQGDAHRTAPTIVYRQRGAGAVVPFTYRRLRRAVRRVYRTAPATYGDRGSLVQSLTAHLLEFAPRRGNGANGIAVQSITSTAFKLPAVSDLRQWLEITPELPEIDPRDACAVHRADMSGQNGVLALTARLDSANDKARSMSRQRLQRPRPRKSDVVRGTAHRVKLDNGKTVIRWCNPLVTATDDQPRKLKTRTTVVHRGNVAPGAFPTRDRVTYLSQANHQHDYRQDMTPRPRVFAVDRAGDVVDLEASHGTTWQGFYKVHRGPLATTSRGNRARRTTTITTTPATETEWLHLVESLAPGERRNGTSTSDNGITNTWSVCRGKKYSGTVKDAHGNTARISGLRTTTATARRLHHLVN